MSAPERFIGMAPPVPDERPAHITSVKGLPFQTAVERVMTRAEAEDILVAIDEMKTKGHKPADWLTWAHIATALSIAGNDQQEALAAAHRAMELNCCATTLLATAVILETYGRFEEALDYARRGIRLDPTHQFVGLLYAQGLLRQAEWEKAWGPFEWYCWGRIWKELEQYIPEWQGEPLAGKRLLVMQGGGFGDNMMFLRWIGECKKAGAYITYACPEPMIPLLQGHPWLDCLVPTHEGPETDMLPEFDLAVTKDGVPQFDYFIPIMGLPRRFNATVETIPWNGPYIRADKELARFREATVRFGDGRYVGICWRAAEVLDPRRHRSLNDWQAARLLNLRGFNWVSLQYGIRSPVTACNIIEPQIRNWADTAAIIENLDLVVTVDTGVMHLAGAMGKPTWVILPGLSDWKFFVDRDDSPFYPSLRVFRNYGLGMGDSLNKVLSELTMMPTGRSPGGSSPRQ